MAKKGKIKVKKSAQLRKKGDGGARKAPTRLPADVGASFKVKVRKKR